LIILLDSRILYEKNTPLRSCPIMANTVVSGALSVAKTKFRPGTVAWHAIVAVFATKLPMKFALSVYVTRVPPLLH